MSTRHNSRGFTFIEVAFSGLIFAVAIIGMSAAIAQGTHLNDAARDELAVATTSRSLLAEINDTDFNKLVEVYNNMTFDVEGLNPADGGKVGKVLIADVDGVAGLKQVTLVVAYKTGGDVKTVRHIQYVTDAVAFGNIDEGPK